MCEGVTKRCGTGYGVHTYNVELRGRDAGQKKLCNSCMSIMEHGGYTLTQLADVPAPRVVKTETPRGKSDPSAWQNWIDRDQNSL